MTPELVVLLLLVICGAAIAARKVGMATPIVFLVTGVGLGFLPAFSNVAIKPEWMLSIFLPPLLMEAAFRTSIRDLRERLRPVLQLAIGLVFVLSAAVAWALVTFIPGFTWPLGFVVGALLAPPDAIAAIATLKRHHVPKRLNTQLEGESLLNDATGLVIYKFALAAVIVSEFHFGEALKDFAWIVICGHGVGAILGFAFVKIFPRIKETSVEILCTFILPYVAYFLAEHVHGSGVLAVVTAGLVLGWHAPHIFNASFRHSAEAVWQTIIFILNALVFVLIGIHLPALLERLKVYEIGPLLLNGFLLCVLLSTVRMAYVFLMAYGVRFLFPKLREKDPYPRPENLFILGWVSMRGVITLALALALPLTLADGTPFPHRDMILFFALGVIIGTIIFQGLTLPFLLKKLTLSSDYKHVTEGWHARREAARNALDTLNELSYDPDTHQVALERVRNYYMDKLDALGDGPVSLLDNQSQALPDEHPVILAESRIWQSALESEKHTLLNLRRSYQINDDVMYDIMQDIDLMERLHKKS